jgi:FkbM family methyltransferase
MLISGSTVYQTLQSLGIQIHGVLHVGAHECEELDFYTQTLHLTPSDVVWIDAIQEKVEQSKARGIPNVYQAVVTDEDNKQVSFKITNNVQSSSILEFGTHAQEHPHVVFVSQRTLPTTTLNTFFNTHGFDKTKYDFWNFDIQGAELFALRGASELLPHAKAIYLEVNTNEVYKGCAKIDEIDSFLGERGFRRVLTNITQHGWGDALYVRH